MKIDKKILHLPKSEIIAKLNFDIKRLFDIHLPFIKN